MKRWLMILILAGLTAVCGQAHAQSSPAYTVEYYAQLDRFAPNGDTALTIIDTSGGRLPANGVPPSTRSIWLREDGSVYTEQVLTEIYRSQVFSFYHAPGVAWIDTVSSANPSYVLSQLWKKTGEEWMVYDEPQALRFTNHPSQTGGETVLIEEGTVLRLVYEPTDGSHLNDAVFFDYDITDGQTYSDAAFTQTTDRTQADTVYVKTGREGINRFSADGAALGFGNQNTGTEIALEQWNGQYLNCTNNSSFHGCCFGLAAGLNDQGLPQFAAGVSAPDLFSAASVAGKTVLNGWQLDFARSGDTYTLQSVLRNDQTVLEHLNRFSSPDERYPNIQTNHFWPMDFAPSWNQPGHDIAFGRRDLRDQRRYGSGAFQFLPEADDGLDHNSYFGMSFEVRFTLSTEYTGPLEYLFFGDDDMWVFLEDRLICDIGGVHSSVGEYVNLWDYIQPAQEAREYTLRFFYTERGASGSTCFMSFTLPSVSRAAQLEKTGGLSVEKTVHYGDDPAASFPFTVVLSDAGLSGRYGQMVFVRGRASFTLQSGQRLLAEGLPQNLRYTVSETPLDGYVITHSGSTGSIQAGQTAEASFTNIRVTPSPAPSPTPSPAPSPTPSPAPSPIPSVSPVPPSGRPKTGDAASPLLWMVLALLSALGLWRLLRPRH